jgi:hypothetical protein
MGNDEFKCTNVTEDATCNPTCFENVCAPKPSFLAQDHLTEECARLTQELCGEKKQLSNVDYSHRCEWASKADHNPEVVCSGGAWIPSDIGGCSTANSQLESTCKVIKTTECLTSQSCDADLAKACAPITATVPKTCKLPCLNARGGNDADIKKCSICTITAMLGADSPNVPVPAKGVPDIFPCCGCLVDFGVNSWGFDKKDFIALMERPCRIHPVLDDDDNLDDDDQVATAEF